METKNKIYVNVAFPYPSGAGLHVGHSYNYAIIDSYCRWLTYYQNKEVFQPFGYDAHGLPTELYAAKHNREPRDVAYENINKFRNQMQDMHTNYVEKLITSDTSYQKWTQWLFLKLKEHGLCYKKKAVVCRCPSCETVVSNEQVENGKCERCSTPVEQKEMDQWYFKITDYRERLIKNLGHLDYPAKTKKMQINWLESITDWCVSRQRKWGCPIPIEGELDTIDTFVDSSIYYIRYNDPENENELCSKDKYKQVDLYVIGSEHCNRHLIYARFIHMFLYDIGLVPVEEPFVKVIHQGHITKDGFKMSKTKGNTVTPDDYDSDEIRMYLCFIGHYFDGGDWSDKNIVGIKRFFNRIDKWLEAPGNDDISKEIDIMKSKIDKFVTDFKFNKVVSTMMEFYNDHKNKNISIENITEFKKVLGCFAPKKYS
jgi:leucyl-tRNA synthetase